MIYYNREDYKSKCTHLPIDFLAIGDFLSKEEKII